MNGDFIDALRQIEREKDIPFDQLLITIESALASAYRRAFGQEADVKLRMDSKGRGLRPVIEKTVVETVEDPHRQISLRDAQRSSPAAKLGDPLDFDLPSDGFGRIAAQ